jgi:FkbM family methyltransferase
MQTSHYLKKLKLLGFKKLLLWKIFNILKIKKLLKISLYEKDFYLRTLTTDLEVLLENLDEEYSIAKDFLSQKSKNIIIDAGGYIGSSAIIFSKLFPKYKILTIEPENSNFKSLLKNIKPYKNIRAINAALIIKNQKNNKHFLYSGHGGESGFSLLGRSKNKIILNQKKTNLLTLLDIKNKYEKNGYIISIIKLDIEGYEKNIFKYEKNFLKNIPIIFVELHERIEKNCEYEFKKFVKNRFTKKMSGEKYISVGAV